MATSQPVKKNQSSIQVLKTFGLMLEGDFTMAELVTELNAREKKALFSNSTVSKYINTCRFCGIEIHKIHNRYYLSGMPFGLNFSSNEINLIQNLQQIAENNFSKKVNNAINAFVDKLSRFSNKRIVRVENKTYEIALERFENAIYEKRRVILMFKNSTSMEVIPISVVYHNNKTYFNVFDGENEKLISLESLTGLNTSNVMFNKKFAPITVKYELFGDLAKRYSKREHEQVTDIKENSIVISNTGENKELLFSRLMRYDSCCEILYPKSYREEMKTLLNNMLSNYGE